MRGPRIRAGTSKGKPSGALYSSINGLINYPTSSRFSILATHKRHRESLRCELTQNPSGYYGFHDFRHVHDPTKFFLRVIFTDGREIIVVWPLGNRFPSRQLLTQQGGNDATVASFSFFCATTNRPCNTLRNAWSSIVYLDTRRIGSFNRLPLARSPREHAVFLKARIKHSSSE